jgi:uncharacterized coiled-coil protein SlyX
LKSTIAKQEAAIAGQRQGMDLLTGQLKQQAAQIQKVSAQLEVGRSAAEVGFNNP